MSASSSPAHATMRPGLARPTTAINGTSGGGSTYKSLSFDDDFDEGPGGAGGGGGGGSGNSNGGSGAAGGGLSRKTAVPTPMANIDEVGESLGTDSTAAANPTTTQPKAPPSPFSLTIERLIGRQPYPPSALAGAPIKVGWLKKREGVLGGFKRRWCVLTARQVEFFREVNDDKSDVLGSVLLPGASIVATTDPSASTDARCEFVLQPVVGRAYTFRAENERERAPWLKLLLELTALPDGVADALFDPDNFADLSNQEVTSLLLPALPRLLAKVSPARSLWGDATSPLMASKAAATGRGSGGGGGSGGGVDDNCLVFSGYLHKLGDKVRNIKRRYFVLVGHMLLYLENEEAYQTASDTGNAGYAAPARLQIETAAAAEACAAAGTPIVASNAAAAAAVGELEGGNSLPLYPQRPRIIYGPGDKTAYARDVLAHFKAQHCAGQFGSHLLRPDPSQPPQQNSSPSSSSSSSSAAAVAPSPKSSSSSASFGLGIDSDERRKEREKILKRALRGDELKPALGMLSLRGCTVSLSAHAAHAHGFSVLTTSGRTYQLFAESDEESRLWLFLLHITVQAAPLKPYMQASLHAAEMAQQAMQRALAQNAPVIDIPSAPVLTGEEMSVLKKHLFTLLSDHTHARYLRNWWAEHQAFHDLRSYTQLQPLVSPLRARQGPGPDAPSYFPDLLTDRAGPLGEHALTLPLHYLTFLQSALAWMSLPSPSDIEDPPQGQEDNPFARPDDPFFVQSCAAMASSYRQRRLEELLEQFVAHGAPTPVFLERHVRDEVLSASLRGSSAPNKVAPAASLLQKVVDLVTELITVEVLPVYLRAGEAAGGGGGGSGSGSGPRAAWTYLAAVVARYDESLMWQRAEAQLPMLLSRGYSSAEEASNIASLSDEVFDAEEDSRLRSPGHANLSTVPGDELVMLAREVASYYGALPQTDPNRMFVHAYLLALEKLQDYRALFNSGPALLAQQGTTKASSTVPPQQRQAELAWEIFHSFLVPGARWQLCIPVELVRLVRDRLPRPFGPPVRRQRRPVFAFMDVEHLVLTELRHALREVHEQGVVAQAKKKSKDKQAAAVAAAKKAAEAGSVDALRLAVAEGTAFRIGAAAPAMNIDILPDDPFPSIQHVLGVPSLFALLRRHAFELGREAPDGGVALLDQLAFVSRLFDYRSSLSEPRLLQLYARQTYSQYCADGAPNHVMLTKPTLDQLRAAVSLASPGPHAFLGVMRELMNQLEPFYQAHLVSRSSSGGWSALQACLVAQFAQWVREEVSVTQGRVAGVSEPTASALASLSNNRNAATWLDLSPLNGAAGNGGDVTSALDESLVNLSSHQALWTSYFRSFLIERYCSENFLFTLDCDDHRATPGPTYRALRARRLFEKYIPAKAELQVNVPSWMAKELTAVLGAGSEGATAVSLGTASARPSVAAAPGRPSVAAANGAAGAAASVGSGSGSVSGLSASSPLLFIAAQREIFLLMEKDTLKPFTESQLFKNYRQACQAKIVL
jgi:hypothetical protein